MGSNNNKNQQQQSSGYGPNPGASGNDPKGRVQNQVQYQQQRYEGQQGPVADAMAYNYGRGSETDFGDRTDIMNQYRDIASNGGSSGGSGGGGGGFSGSHNTYTVSPKMASTERASAGMVGPARQLSVDKLDPLERVNAERMGGTLQQAQTERTGPNERVNLSDPYNSYKGFQEFGQTGGYSGQDMNNLRARGMSPIRAAYANAERNVGQQRSLQGGYSPNAIAAQAKMAREQGQGMADALQDVEAGIVDTRNKNRLSGYEGMSNIEQARQKNQLTADTFNSQEARLGNEFNAGEFNKASQYNAGQFNQGREVDVNNALAASKFNSEQGRLANQYNIDNQFNTGKFNIGNELDIDKTNVGNQMDVSKYNAGQGNDVGKFNADLDLQGQRYNADAYTQTQNQMNAEGASNSARSAAASAQNNDDRLRALAGMSNLYGTTPGMSNMFGNQVTNMVGQGGNMGLGYINAEGQAQGMPGAYEQTTGRIQDGMNLFGAASNAIYPWLGRGNQQQPTRQPAPSYQFPTNQNFNPSNYGNQVDMSGWG